MTDTSIQRIAELIPVLAPVPNAWVQAAQALPSARRSLDALVESCCADTEMRAAVLADLERALAEAGVEAGPSAVRYLRARLGP